MKVGQQVSFYIIQEHKERRLNGRVIAFNDLVVEILPNGKNRAVTVPKSQVYGG